MLVAKAAAGFKADEKRPRDPAVRNPILGEALNPVIDYGHGTERAKRALSEGRRVR